MFDVPPTEAPPFAGAPPFDVIPPPPGGLPPFVDAPPCCDAPPLTAPPPGAVPPPLAPAVAVVPPAAVPPAMLVPAVPASAAFPPGWLALPLLHPCPRAAGINSTQIAVSRRILNLRGSGGQLRERRPAGHLKSGSPSPFPRQDT